MASVNEPSMSLEDKLGDIRRLVNITNSLSFRVVELFNKIGNNGVPDLINTPQKEKETNRASNLHEAVDQINKDLGMAVDRLDAALELAHNAVGTFNTKETSKLSPSVTNIPPRLPDYVGR